MPESGYAATAEHGHALPATTVPATTVPATTVPTSTVPTSTVPAATVPTSPAPVTGPAPRRAPRAHHIGFWVTAAAFCVNMGFSAVPTPLYVLYQQRDHFSNLMITVVYAVYAVGVIGSLFLAGHLSDWTGRRRIFVPALIANVASGVIFILAPGLAGLIVGPDRVGDIGRADHGHGHQLPGRAALPGPGRGPPGGGPRWWPPPPTSAGSASGRWWRACWPSSPRPRCGCPTSSSAPPWSCWPSR